MNRYLIVERRFSLSFMGTLVLLAVDVILMSSPGLACGASGLMVRSVLTLKRLLRLICVARALSFSAVVPDEGTDEGNKAECSSDETRSRLPSSRKVRSVNNKPRKGMLGVAELISLRIVSKLIS